MKTEPGAGKRIRGSGTIQMVVLGIWLAIAAALDPALLRLFREASGIAAVLVLCVFIGCLHFFWLLASYYLVSFVFSKFSVAKMRLAPMIDRPAVAVLYTTMNDFQERAASSCVEQNYSNFRVFVLDDSSDPACRVAVDRFASKHGEKVTVIRRNDRKGHKAGNLNHALRVVGETFPYFAVVDADNVLPTDFIAALLPYFTIDDTIGYVQGNQRPNPDQPSAFAQDLGLGMIPHWLIYYPSRNRFGNIIFAGHGGIVRTDVWRAVGGFPELVSEDLAFSTRAAQLGYRGYFAPDVVSYEDFPAGYHQLRRQQERYITGICEYLQREFWPFVKSRVPRWHEKLDVLMSCGAMLSPVVFVIFVAVYSLVMPLFFSTWGHVAIDVGDTRLASWAILAHSDSFLSLWSREFFAVTTACTVVPLLGCLDLMRRWPRHSFKLMFLSAAPQMSLAVMQTVAVLSYLWSNHAAFLVTGDRAAQAVPRGRRQAGAFLAVSSRRSPRLGLGALELLFGVTLAVACLLTVNVSVLAFSFAIVLAPVLLRARWEARWLRPLLYAPLALIVLGVVLAGMNMVAAQGSLFGGVAFHF